MKKDYSEFFDLFRSESNDEVLFNPGALINDIERFETNCGISLPKEVKEFYSIANGQKDAGGCLMGFWLNSLDEIEKDFLRLKGEIQNGEYRDLNGVSIGPVKPYWHHQFWVPIFGSDNENISIDLDPSEGGTIGQLILIDFWEPERIVLSKDIISFIKIVVEKIGTNQLVYDEEIGEFSGSGDESLSDIFNREIE